MTPWSGRKMGCRLLTSRRKKLNGVSEVSIVMIVAPEPGATLYLRIETSSRHKRSASNSNRSPETVPVPFTISSSPSSPSTTSTVPEGRPSLHSMAISLMALLPILDPPEQSVRFDDARIAPLHQRRYAANVAIRPELQHDELAAEA